MPTSRARRPSSRREGIVESLIDLYLEEGFAALGVGDLAVRLRCSKSTLYAVAPSKEQLIATVVRAFFRRSTERVEAVLAAESDPVRRIRAYLDAIATELAPASTDFYRDVEEFGPTREIYATNTAVAAARVRDLVADAELPGRPVDAAFVGVVAAETMAAIQQGRVQSLTGRDDASAYRSLADLITAGLAGASAR
ncbi:TetR/AcrR family transcriptional regulator [Nocardioides sambongensis]|uniref:TetR/AcrR family transcriptional regulator n=1 Tax=Nocardioides sambongensis TaxID=2589074 RepID=UPI00112A9E02|nr:TetR/AcrR family transcriptional regulator [Nocardioides sambongensis]